MGQAAAQQDELYALLATWRADPERFVRDVFRVEPDDWQITAMRDIATHDRVSIRSGHGIGKSAMLSWTILWWITTRLPCKVACTAPTAHQLNDVLWGEIAKWHQEMDPALRDMIDVKADRVELKVAPRQSFAVARTARKEQPEAFQGFHCLAEDHQILTRRGWLDIDEVSCDDLVLSMPVDGEEAEWMQITAVHKYPFVGNMNVYEGNSVSFSVTDEHRFPTKYMERVKHWKMKRLSEMAGQFMVRRSTNWAGEDFEIPEEFDGFSKEDFARFIGLWLSEGGTRPHKTGVFYEVLLYQKKEDGCAYIDSIVGKHGFRYTKDYFHKSDRRMAAWLLANCGSTMTTKRIPDVLKNAKQDILDCLVEGLWMGDGSFREDGKRGQYYSTSKRLMDDIQEVLLKTGHLGSIGVNRAEGMVANGGAVTANTAYVITHSYHTTDHIVKTKKIRKEPYNGRVWCISTPHQTFFTRRNGKVCLSGNSEHMLFIVDEASGVDDIIFQVGQGAMSTKGAKTLLVGNPTRASGFFYDSHTKMRSIWKTHKVGCADARMVDQAFVDTMRMQYGEDSNVYRVRVLGEFPTEEDSAVIPLEPVMEAARRDIEMPKTGKVVWGVDVARFGDDESALAKRFGPILLEPVKTWRKMDTMQTSGKVIAEYEKTEKRFRPDEILVDVIGIGAGVVDRLKEQGYPVRGVNVAESPAVGFNLYMRQRDELWWKGREWFLERGCKIPEEDDELITELIGPTFVYTSGGRIQVESKSDMKKRGVKSPNRADAFLLTFATSDRPINRRLEYPNLGIV